METETLFVLLGAFVTALTSIITSFLSLRQSHRMTVERLKLDHTQSDKVASREIRLREIKSDISVVESYVSNRLNALSLLVSALNMVNRGVNNEITQSKIRLYNESLIQGDSERGTVLYHLGSLPQYIQDDYFSHEYGFKQFIDMSKGSKDHLDVFTISKSAGQLRKSMREYIIQVSNNESS